VVNLLISLGCCASAFGQTTVSSSGQISSATITAVGVGDHVRITAPSSIVQMRVEIYDDSGANVWDSQIRGNVFDWRNGAAKRLLTGDYTCVVTVKNIAGRVSQKIGSIGVTEKEVRIGRIKTAELSATQSQAIGPLEEDSSWAILTEDQNQTTTVIGNDGTDAQVIRGRGAISFRLGDFFSGKDTEQMRLTEEGNFGIGTSKPEFKLDVLGAIRAREGFVFNNGSTLNVNDKGALTLIDPDGSITPNIAGSGTQNKLAKWTDNSGTLGDSAVTESNGNLGIGTSSPSGKFHLHGAAGQAADVRMTNDSISSPFTFGGALPNNLGARFTFATVNEGGLAAQGFTDGNSPAFRFQGHVGTTSPTQIPVIFEGFKSNGGGDRAPLGATEKVFGFYNGAFDAGGAVLMSMTGNGNVGIGTTNPQTKLHVFGDAIRFDNGSGKVMDINAGDINNIVALNNSLGLGSQGPTGSNHVIINPFPSTGPPGFRNGNVGIGTFSPQTKLHVESPGQAEITLRSPDNKSVLALDSNISAQRRVWTLENGLFGFPGLFGIFDRTAGRTGLAIDTNGNVGIGNINPAAKLHVGGTVKADGNATQERDKGGWAKAMVYVNGDGTLLRCYNGITGESTGDCGGISSSRGGIGASSGAYSIAFPFTISDRFLSVSVQNGTFGSGVAVNFQITASTRVTVHVFEAHESNAIFTDRPFMVIVY